MVKRRTSGSTDGSSQVLDFFGDKKKRNENLDEIFHSKKRKLKDEDADNQGNSDPVIDDEGKIWTW